MKPAPRFLAVALAVAVATGFAAQSTPLQIEQTVEPQFPAALGLSSLTQGEARVVINVDADGKLVDWLVSGYTDKAFAREAVQALQRWRYTPATSKGEPIGVRVELKFEFEAKGRVISLMAIETNDVLFRQMGISDYVSQVCRPHELDQPVAPVNASSPHHPGTDAASMKPQTVVVDFYIDEKGQPRMPVVLNSPQEAFAMAAVGALNQWRFNTPTRAGKPVSVRVRQQFIFPARS